MNDQVQLSDTIGAIYDAAIDARWWPAALQMACDFMGARLSLLVLQDFADNHWSVHQWGLSELLQQRYIEHEVIAGNFMARRAWSWPIGAVHAGYAMTQREGPDADVFHASRFYNEFVVATGAADAAHALLDKTNTALARVTFGFGAGLPHSAVDDRMLAQIKLLVPHFRRAVLIGRLLDAHSVQTTDLSSALDRLTTAVFLLAADGSRIYANREAERLLSLGAFAIDRRGQLMSPAANASAELRSAIHAACDGDVALGATGVALPLESRDGARYVAHVLALASASRRKLSHLSSAAAAVFVQKSALPSRISGAVLAALYGLTPMEVRVLMAVVDIGGVGEMAEALHLSEATIRTHLRHLFIKTDTHRQAELVKLVASFSSPISA